MITLVKLEKPDILVKNEQKWVNQMMEYVDKGEVVPKGIIGKYSHNKIKTQLLLETNQKCAYCESIITAIDYGDIEHIIPKSHVPIKTFDWSNLTIACGKCNQNKGDYHNPNLPLINPYLDKPEEIIVFWGPLISPRTQKAEITVKKLKLDRPELFERRTSLLKTIQPMIQWYLSVKDYSLKKEIYQDLLKYTNKDKEYSSMMTYVLNSVQAPEEITN